MRERASGFFWDSRSTRWFHLFEPTKEPFWIEWAELSFGWPHNASILNFSVELVVLLEKVK